ncbi:hypothetical protein ACQ0QQ_00305 [Lysinibacillus sphaericus]
MYTYLQKKLSSFIKKSIDEEHNELKVKIQALENEVQLLKTSMVSGLKNNLSTRPEPSKIVIEHLSIENVNIDHADLSNNFGNLGIKDLKGQLYIGTTYDKLKQPNEITKELSSSPGETQQPASKHLSPKVNVTSREEGRSARSKDIPSS